VGLQVVFSTHIREEKKSYCTHLQACKWFFLLTQEKKINDIAHLQASSDFLIFK
jgi:hypothetical protein